LKKRVILAAVVMTAWAAGFYALGRHHGVTKGSMEIPTVQIKWGSNEPAKEAASTEVVDYVAISNSVCDGTYSEKFGPEVQAKVQAKAKAEGK